MRSFCRSIERSLAALRRRRLHLIAFNRGRTLQRMTYGSDFAAIMPRFIAQIYRHSQRQHQQQCIFILIPRWRRRWRRGRRVIVSCHYTAVHWRPRSLVLPLPPSLQLFLGIEVCWHAPKVWNGSDWLLNVPHWRLSPRIPL